MEPAITFNLAELDSDNGFFINGIGSRSVSDIGDFNGDNVDDFILGSQGTGYVIFGNNSGFPKLFNLSSLNGQNGFSVSNEERNTGRFVRGGWDINGDTFDDFIIGGFSASVVFGSDNGFLSAWNLSDLDGQDGFLITGNEVRSGSQSSVSGTGDVNGDGVDDFVVIGEPTLSEDGTRFEGVSYVIFGRRDVFESPLNVSMLDTSVLDGSNGFVINGILGQDVSEAGDINNDGFEDFIIGGYSKTVVVFGSNDFPELVQLNVFLDGSNGFTLDGVIGVLAAIGDVNGDEIDDFLVGGGSKVCVVFGRNGDFPALFDQSSLDGNNGFVLETSGARITAIDGAGDFNGDGLDDLIFGAAEDSSSAAKAGISYVVLGSSNGFPASLNLSNLDNDHGLIITGIPQRLELLGRAVAGGGDVNGDDFDDLIISGGGRSQVVFGGFFLGSNDLSVLENSPQGTSVGLPFTVITRSLSYELTGGNIDLDGDGNTPFTINPTTGQIVTNDSDDLDREAVQEFNLEISATHPSSSSQTKVAVVNLINVDEPGNEPPSVGDLNVIVDERDIGNGSVIGIIPATDDDLGDSLTFAITSSNDLDLNGNGRPAFIVNSSTGAVIVNDINDRFAELTFEVTATDTGGLSDTGTVALTGGRSVGFITGDPHLDTFDQLRYDFQARGEYTLVHFVDENVPIQVQLAPFAIRPSATVVSAAATLVDGQLVSFSLGSSPLHVNGEPVYLPINGVLTLGEGMVERITNNQYTVTYPWGSQVIASLKGPHDNRNRWDLEVQLTGTETVVGLLGNNDGDPSNDLMLNTGEVLQQPVDENTILGALADSWRVPFNESLLLEEVGEAFLSIGDQVYAGGGAGMVDVASSSSPTTAFSSTRVFSLSQSEELGAIAPHFQNNGLT